MDDASSSPKQQLIEALRSAERVLITAHENPDGDALGSALALQHVLDRLGKHTTVAMSGKLDSSFSFLNGFSSVESDVAGKQEFMIVLDEAEGRAKNVEVRRLDDNHIALVVIPESGQILSENITFEPGKYLYDLIIVLDSSKIEQLGELYTKHTELFTNVPVASIDHHIATQPYGKYNFSDTNAAATAEIMVSVIESLTQAETKDNLIDNHVATCLLTGLMTDTGSFQNSNTTPKSLTVAAQMVALGADHRRIVTDVFKTRSISQLRLWGKALAHLKEDKPLRFAWATLTRADFVSAQAGDEEVSGLVDTLLKTAADTDFVILLSERSGGLHGSLRSIKEGIDVQRLATLFGGGGHTQAAAFLIPAGTLTEHEQRIINTIRDQQRQSLAPAARV